MIDIQAFYDFCAAKPADESYDYTDVENCAIGQFLKSQGHKRVNVDPIIWQSNRGEGKITEELDEALRLGEEYKKTRTFGELTEWLERLR